MTVDISGTYPQTAPTIILAPIKGKTFVTSKLCEELLKQVNELAAQNVGMPSIYLLAQHVQVSG
jgi:predicted helicase